MVIWPMHLGTYYLFVIFRKEFRSLRKLEKKTYSVLHRAKKKVITPANYIRCVDIALNLFTKKIFRTAYLKRSRKSRTSALIMSVLSYNSLLGGNFSLLFLYQPISKLLLIDMCCQEWFEPI